MEKAYSYIRFSTPEQAKGDSYRRQREACEAFCATEGLQLATEEEYTFFDKGRSAYKGKHINEEGELKRFLELVEDGSIKAGSWLIVESLDRLSRENISTALPRFLDLLNKGINIYTLADRHKYTKEFNQVDLFISIISMSRANEESSVKGLRVRHAWQRKQQLAREEKRPLGAATPSWINYSKDKGYEINQERAEIIRRIFDMSINGKGKGVICKELNHEGVLAFGGANRGSGSQSWSASSVQKLLNNKALLGEYQPYNMIEQENGKLKRLPSGEPIDGFFPRVISNEVFYQAQAAINNRLIARSTKQTKNFNIWSGIVKCGLCGGPMHIVDKGRPPKGAKYLVCWNKRKGLCEAANLRLEKSEQVYKEILAKVDSLALVQDSSAKISKKLSEYEGKLSEMQVKLANAGEAFLAHPSDYGARIISEIEKQVENLKTEKNSLELSLANSRITNKHDFFEKLDLESYEGRNRANSLLKRLNIEVYARKKPDGWIYKINQKGKPIFAAIEIEGYISTLAFSDTQLEKILEQEGGWRGHLSALFSEKVIEKDLNGMKDILEKLRFELLQTVKAKE